MLNSPCGALFKLPVSSKGAVSNERSLARNPRDVNIKEKLEFLSPSSYVRMQIGLAIPISDTDIQIAAVFLGQRVVVQNTIREVAEVRFGSIANRRLPSNR
jgi:hypothetical protein